MKAWASRGFYVACYFISWGWFALVGLIFNMACAPLLLVPARNRIGIWVRRIIHSLFNLWRCWLHASGVVRVTWIGFDRPLSAGTIYIANHPTLVDATFILTKLPDAICVMKKSLMRNPVIAPAALLAGYVASGKSVDTVRDASAKVAAGRSLLVFPEGTRTAEGTIVGALNPAFLLCAERAKAPVQLVLVRASPELGSRGRAWWRPPSQLPGWIIITLDCRWEWDAGRSSTELLTQIEGRMASILSGT